MATFEAQVEGLTSLAIDGSSAPTQTELTKFLTDGVKEVINVMQKKLHYFCATDDTFTSVAVGSEAEVLTSGDVLQVIRSDGTINQPCVQISYNVAGRASDTTDIKAATATYPVYYIYNGKINALPASGSCKYLEIKRHAVSYGDSSIGPIALTGVTTTGSAGANYTFTSNSHGLSVGDVVELNNFSELTGLNGMISQGVATVADANSFTLDGVISTGTQETTGGNVVKAGGFPDEAEYLVALYAAIKSLQNVMGNMLTNAAIDDTAMTYLKAAVDQAETAADKFENADTESVFGDEDTYLTASSQLTRVKAALDDAEGVINANEPSATTDAYGAQTNEDIELVTSALNIAQTEIQRAQAHLSEWVAIGDMRAKEVNAALAEANGYISEINTRVARDKQKYDWYAMQQTKLQQDYDKGIAILRGPG